MFVAALAPNYFVRPQKWCMTYKKWVNRSSFTDSSGRAVFSGGFPNADLHVFEGGGHDLGFTHAPHIAPLIIQTPYSFPFLAFFGAVVQHLPS